MEVVCKVPTKEPTEDRKGCTTEKQDKASLEGIDGLSLIQCNQLSTFSGGCTVRNPIQCNKGAISIFSGIWINNCSK